MSGRYEHPGIRRVLVAYRSFGGVRIHDREDCSAVDHLAMTTVGNGHCPFDNPSDHKMRDWPMSIRVDRYGLVERHCEHGVGHPDPDSTAFLNALYPLGAWSTHGCCGCCIDTRDHHFIAG